MWEDVEPKRTGGGSVPRNWSSSKGQIDAALMVPWERTVLTDGLLKAKVGVEMEDCTMNGVSMGL